MAEKDSKSALEKAAEKARAPGENDFWDNIANAIINRVLGSGQAWSHLADTLNLPKSLRPDPTGKLSTKDIDELVKKSRPTEGWGGVVGDVIALSPTMAIPGGPIVSGAAAGAISGITEPVRGGDFYGEKAVQTSIGAGTGVAAGIFGKLLGEAAKRAPDAFNREAIEAALPPGAKITKIGNAGLEQAEKAWDDAYKNLTPSLKANLDGELVSKLEGIERSMLSEGATAADVERFHNVIVGQIIEPLQRGTLVGEGVQNIQSKLGKIARRNKDIGFAINEARGAFLEAIERASPEASKELSALRAKYPAFLAVQKASEATSSEGGVFTPNALVSASKSVDNAAERSIAEAARTAKVGEPTTTSKLLGGFPILGPGSRMLEESAVLREAGRAAESAVVPGVSAISPLMNRSTTPQGGFQTEESGFAPLNPQLTPTDDTFGAPEGPDIDQFLQQYMDQKPTEDLDGFLGPYMKESQVDHLTSAIEEQESGGRNVVSAAGARGPMQIMPATFKRYARLDENIDNPQHNRRVGRRMVADLLDKYGDPRAVASAYFSGQPNYRSLKSDVNGKNTMSYVEDVMKKLNARTGNKQTS